MEEPPFFSTSLCPDLLEELGSGEKGEQQMIKRQQNDKTEATHNGLMSCHMVPVFNMPRGDSCLVGAK